MKYKTLLPAPKRGSRLTETIGVNDKQLVLNSAIQAKMKVPHGECWMALFEREDGRLCLFIQKDNNARTGFRLTKPKSSGNTRFVSPGRAIMERLPNGRYRITETDGAIFVTECQMIPEAKQ